MLYSRLFGKTVRHAPSDTTLVSHKLLYQAGYIRDLAAGRYTFLPLGMRVREKIINIIDEEMEKIGSQRLITPTLHPMKLWEATNRDTAFGEGLMRVTDRRGAEFALGATAEGVMVDLINKFSPSYKDLPIVIHQFSSKFRDELRARGGLIRVREFTMKDAYSFCATAKSLDQVYQKMYQAYQTIAERLGIPVVAVEAFSGAIGGKECHEFVYINDAGEDTILICDKCGYAANAEKAEFVRDDINSQDKELPLEDVHQPARIDTIEEMSAFFGLSQGRMLKDVMYKGSDGKFYVAIIRGDLNVREEKLAIALSVDELVPATEEDLAKLGTKRGSVPVAGLEGVTFIGDLSLKTVKNFVGGYKREKEELEWKNVNLGRDFKVSQLLDIAEAPEGARCARCQKGKLHKQRGIEFGHVFKLDHFYTQPMKGVFVDKDGQEKPGWFGSYGIGIGRAMACIVEAGHDDKGIIWPASVAPYQVHLLSIGKGEEVLTTTQELYTTLQNQECSVLYDDRDESAGVKLTDADLIGIPVRVVVSARSLASGGYEVKKRDQEKSQILTKEELSKFLGEVYYSN